MPGKLLLCRHMETKAVGEQEARVQVDCRQGVLVLTLNRPHCLNAIDNALARELLAGVQGAERDPDTRVILLRGAGRAFCAGRDVSAPPTEDDLVLVQAVASAIVHAAVPVVTAVHGWTVGAGLEWMLATDIAVAASSARFRLPEASLGVFVTGGITATLSAAAGLQRAKALMLLGETFDAKQAAEWGLVWKVVDEGELDAASWAIAARLAELEPHVAAQFKQVLNGVGLAAFDQAVEEESRVQRFLQRR
jgi:2-(1,2-epoxy-1,2-dihydrophenyl)acetyl-CoA isomerase